jgi:hypothetical protein
MSARIPVYRYTIKMRPDGPHLPVAVLHGKDDADPPPQPKIPFGFRAVDAISFREEPPWIIFDDTRASVLVLRAENVDEIARSPEPVGTQTVDELTDPEPEN